MNEGLGLKVKKSCSSTSDAVCEVLDGFFCSDSNGGGCRTAQRHTVCSPGQYIGQRGTADKDTECLHCTDGTFSNGTSSSCLNHTKCESKELKQVKPGTDSTDSECGAAGEGTPDLTSTSLLSLELPAGLETSILPALSSETQPAKELADLSLDEATQKQNKKEEEEDRKSAAAELLHWASVFIPTSDYPEPTRDQKEHTIPTIPDATMDDQHDDQSPAPPSSSTHNGSVSVSVHQEDHQPVLIKRDSGASRSTRACFTIDGY
ncbi:unnamed protein product [Arctogadus glacialis]